MGSLMQEGVPFTSLTRQIPTCTLFNTGNEDWSWGSGRPRAICMLITADRYDFLTEVRVLC